MRNRSWTSRAGALIGVWLWLLLVSAVAGDLHHFVRSVLPMSDRRASLPNYADRDCARQIFADTKKTVEQYAPFVGWERLPMSTRTVNIDANGHRVHRLGRDEGDAVTVGFFGGSTIWGTGTENDATVPSLFDQMTRGGRFFAFRQPIAYLGPPRTDHLELDPARRAEAATLYPLIRAKLAERDVSWATGISDAFD